MSSLTTAAIAFLARHPALHASVRAAYPMIPGLRPFLRRFLPRPAAVSSPLAEIEALLKFDRTRIASEPGPVVTVEQLFLIARNP